MPTLPISKNSHDLPSPRTVLDTTAVTAAATAYLVSQIMGKNSVSVVGPMRVRPIRDIQIMSALLNAAAAAPIASE